MASNDSGDAVIYPRDHSIYVSASGNIPIGTPRNRRIYNDIYDVYEGKYEQVGRTTKHVSIDEMK